MVSKVVCMAGVQIVRCGVHLVSVMGCVRVLLYVPVSRSGEEISKPRALLSVLRVLFASLLHVNLVPHPFLN